MPNRIIKESIRTSDSINELSWFEECLFYRLIVSCDDFGRFDGRTAIIKSACFPLKDVTNKNIESAINKLVAVGLVGHYTVEEKPYLQLLAWDKHQSIRAKKSKYPSIEESDVIAHENNCMQMHADVPVIQSNPNPNLESNNISSDLENEPEQVFCADLEKIPSNDGTEWVCTVREYEEFKRLYPSVDIKQEFRNMRGWCTNNPTKRKTKRGIKKFVNGWLARQQDSGRMQPKQTTRFNNFEGRNYDMQSLEQKLLGGTPNGRN